MRNAFQKFNFKRKNNGNIRDYDCQNMIYYYCGRFSLKHLGELFMLLQRISHRIPNNPRIFSIGCGPCTDLFAFEKYIKHNKLNEKIKYHGIEKNVLWKEIHNFIIKHGKRHKLSKIEVSYLDAIREFQEVVRIMKEEQPNVILFQYVLSDIAKYYPVDLVKRFSEKFVEKAFEILPKSTMIIFNDTNVTQEYAKRNPDEIKGRIFLEHLSERFWTNRNISVIKYYFPYKDDPSLKFGAAHSDFRVDFSNIPEDLINYFEMWDEYRSAQLVLIKN